MSDTSEPHLIVMSGLPGTGKSTIAEGIARRTGMPIVSVDPIEAAMWTAGLATTKTGIAAYTVAQAIAAENLKLGHSVIVDAVNPVQAARNMWRELSVQTHARIFFIQVLCSDEDVHKQRIESRVRNIQGMSEVTWDQVQSRRTEYEPWTEAPLVLDSAGSRLSELVGQALKYVQTIQAKR